MIQNSLQKLQNHCLDAGYMGWDIFDGLNARLFKGTLFYSSRYLRLAWIQFFKHFPINFRRIVFVPIGYNPKGLGLFASALILLEKMEEAKLLLNLLKGMTCSEYAGISWGYNFDWQARAFYVPVGTPNMVTTVFVANAFLDFFDKTGEGDCLKTAEGCCEFILNELILFEDEDTLCFGYIPGEHAKVHNVNMLGAALLARAYSHTKNQNYYEKSSKAMTYSAAALNDDYSWPYGELIHHQFIDNFHTGFNLVALKGWMDFTGDNTWEEEMRNAYKYFLNTFWLEDGCPKYYHDSLYPIDIHCSAQGMVTCLKLKDYDDRSEPMAKRIAKWAINNMQDEEGYFYYQKTRWYTNKIPYMRWSQAWMFYALAYLISFQEKASYKASII